MSTALVTALRESEGYLRDGGYAQTARLVVLAADEIERLNRLGQARERGGKPSATLSRPADALGLLVKSVAKSPTRAARDLHQRGK
jgi:hypothetical protein